jgi:3-hydroxybutyryl-CoA dehydratase
MISFKKGHTFKLLRKFTKEDVLLFSQICGDRNPLHYDEEYCKKTIFKKPIIFGILGASLFSNLLGNNLDGSIYIKQNLNFLKPIYIDEEIEASVEIKDLIKPKDFLLLKTQVVKLDTNEVAIDGDAVVKYPKDKYHIIL